MLLKLKVQATLVILFIASATQCDLVPSLDPIATPTTFGLDVFSVDWCTCKFLAVGGINDTDGLIGVYQFNQTTDKLSQIGTTTTFGSIVYSVAWCPSCRLLAAGGKDFDLSAIIQLYSFDPLHPGNLELVGSKTSLGSAALITSLDWCSSCEFLAASVSSENPGMSGIINIFSVDPVTGLETVANKVIEDLEVDYLKWCDNCHYLATIMSNPFFTSPSTLSVYSFDHDHPGDIILTASFDSDNHYVSIDWCDCGYIVAGGTVGNSVGVIDIYRFDPQNTQSLFPVLSKTISADISGAFAVAWCQDCDNLAVSVQIGAFFIQLYHFDASTNKLTLQQSYPLNFIARSIAWCGLCCDLATGGFDFNQNVGTIQIFKGNTCLAAPSNLRVQKISHRFPTQVDIVNQLCWDAIATAVAYNVYADAALTILLATIASPSLCYSQHQICSLLRQGFGGQEGKSATYYVTAVDANGNQSLPAIVTI